MTIYVAMVDDRHEDTKPHLFSDPERAVEFAKRKIAELAGDPDEVELEPIPDWSDWIYSASHETSSSAVWIVPREMDEPDAS